jgi:hypothetical protein
VEHRLSRRCNIELEVVLYGRDGVPVRARTVSIGREGLFVQTARPEVFDHRLLSVRFLAGSQQRPMRAYVVHRRGGGAGLWLLDTVLDTEALAHLPWRQG